MQWKTHILAGLASLWVLEFVPTGASAHITPLAIGFATFGAMLPDLDAKESKIKSLAVAGVHPFALPAQAMSSSFGHRGFLHSASALLLVVLLSLPTCLFYGWQPWAALALGYASHLAADACTRSGVPISYVPFLNPTKRRYHLLPRSMRFATGSEAEAALLPLIALLVLMLLLRQLTPAAPGARTLDRPLFFSMQSGADTIGMNQLA